MGAEVPGCETLPRRARCVVEHRPAFVQESSRDGEDRDGTSPMTPWQESVVGPYRTEPVRPKGSRRHRDRVEYAAPECLDRFNRPRATRPQNGMPETTKYTPGRPPHGRSRYAATWTFPASITITPRSTSTPTRYSPASTGNSPSCTPTPRGVTGY